MYVLFFFTVISVKIADLDIQRGEKIIRYFGSFVISVSSFIFCSNLSSSIIRQRWNLIFDENSFYVKDVFFGTKTEFLTQEIIGFSTTDMVTRFTRHHIIILYFTDGQKKEFRKLMLSNFKQLKRVLKSAGYKYLGHEPYSMNILGKRKYKFS